MLILKLILQVLAVGFALLTSTLDYLAYDKRTRWFKHLRVLLYCVVGLFLVVGLAVTVGDDIARREEIAALRSKLTAIRDVVRGMSDAVTGGESFPYVNIVDGRVLLINEGRDPLYDISIRMWEPSGYKDVTTSAQFRALEPRALRFTVSSMPPSSAREVARIQLPMAPVKNFEATIIARNGTFTEQLVMRQVDSVWRTAYRVFRGLERSHSARLLERVDSMFPRDEQGVPRWDNP
jgi:hypothetical protein